MAINLTNSKTDWPLSILIRRALWTFILEPAVRWWPKSFSPLRVAALRLMGAQIGPRCLILPGVKVLMPWNMILEDHVAIGRNVNFYNFAPISIGRQTVISQDVYLCTGSHDYRRSDMPLIFKPISIGRECWVAAGAFVCPGVTITNGVVLGAKSVLTCSIDTEWSVHAGNPAVKIKNRSLSV